MESGVQCSRGGGGVGVERLGDEGGRAGALDLKGDGASLEENRV